MKKWFLLLLPTLAFADDASRIAASRTAVDSIAVSRSYLSTTLGITVMNSIMHPDWVQVDFPLTASSGEAKRRIEAAIRHLILRAESQLIGIARQVAAGTVCSDLGSGSNIRASGHCGGSFEANKWRCGYIRRRGRGCGKGYVRRWRVEKLFA